MINSQENFIYQKEYKMKGGCQIFNILLPEKQYEKTIQGYTCGIFNDGEKMMTQNSKPKDQSIEQNATGQYRQALELN